METDGCGNSLLDPDPWRAEPIKFTPASTDPLTPKELELLNSGPESNATKKYKEKDGLGSRMKEYERVTKQFIPPKNYTIIRLDGCHFHSYTKKFDKPFDDRIRTAMITTMQQLVQDIQGVVFGYHQSDEISLLLVDFQDDDTEAWYKGNIQKIVSVAAAKATMSFNSAMHTLTDINFPLQPADFDARVFTLPTKIEVMNYFLWRIQDAERNSVSGLAQSLYSQKQLSKVNKEQQKFLCLMKGNDWERLPYYSKRGTICVKGYPNFIEPPTPAKKEELLALIPEKPEKYMKVDLPKIYRSVETLSHFSCASCRSWFSIGDAPSHLSTLFCPTCGVKGEIATMLEK